MVFNALAAVWVAHESASACRTSGCVGSGILEDEDGNPLTTTQMLDLVCCFPLQQLGRLVLFVWTFLCVPPRDYYYYLYSYSSDEDDDEGDGVDFGLRDDGASSSSSSRFGYDDCVYDSRSD
ncbi:hypothetical protein MLD38_003379 [Melastoma candidum]|uniref:Uncharacterized protein n=1 Tax=Melastoma candidum TaxID=119954 RepID=A0ACB9S694_9MYRT|nr:hypothetical protein MLD38_003379 [Melastoma candidum]